MRILISVVFSIAITLAIIYFTLKRQGVIGKKGCSCKGKKSPITKDVLKDTNGDGTVSFGEVLDNMGITI